MQNTKKLLKDKTLFISGIVTLVVVFIIIEFFSFGMLSLKDIDKNSQNSNQIIVYINEIDDEAKKEFSKKLLQVAGVSSIRYESKEVALKAAVLELGVEVNESENPLNDAFFVYLNENVNLENLKQSLLNMNEISAVDFRTKALETSLNFSKGLDSLTAKMTTIFVIIGLFMIYNVMRFEIRSRKNEIFADLNEGITVKELKRMFFIESVNLIILSGVISFMVYQLIRKLLIGNIKMIIPSYKSTVPIIAEIGILGLIIIFAIVISAIICYFGMNRYFKLPETKVITKLENEENVVEEDNIEELLGVDNEEYEEENYDEQD